MSLNISDVGSAMREEYRLYKAYKQRLEDANGKVRRLEEEVMVYDARYKALCSTMRAFGYGEEVDEMFRNEGEEDGA